MLLMKDVKFMQYKCYMIRPCTLLTTVCNKSVLLQGMILNHIYMLTKNFYAVYLRVNGEVESVQS